MVGKVVLTALFLLISAGFLLMGIWGLRGRNTYLPPIQPEVGAFRSDVNPPLRGNLGRLIAGAYVIAGVVAFWIAIRRWF